MANVKIYDSGSAFCVSVDGLIVHASNSLGGAFKHIRWMYKVASQKFTVGEKAVPVAEWIEGMRKAGVWLSEED